MPEPHKTYQRQYRHCGKPTCSTCQQGPGHGPYWYAYWWEGGKLRSGYIGKEPPAPAPEEQPREEAGTAGTAGRPDKGSAKRAEILCYIDAFWRKHGWPPSYKEIARGAGLSTLSLVHYYITSLEDRKLLARVAGQARSLRLTRRGRALIEV